jgi:RNA polymerase sigma-70 factor (ECF subfamily)
MMRPERLAHLLDRYAAALELYARQWCAVPEDVVQEAFLKLVQQAKEPDNAAAWLYRVVRNGAISAGRSARRRQQHEAKAAFAADWFSVDESQRLDAATVTAALSHLPDDQREPIVAHLWGGLTFEEIGRLMESSAATAFRRYDAGIGDLRRRLQWPCPTKPTA